MKRLKDMLGMQEVRFMAVEHAVMMFIAIVLIHIGYIRAKKAPSVRQANKSQFLFYLIALIMILVAIHGRFTDIWAVAGSENKKAGRSDRPAF